MKKTPYIKVESINSLPDEESFEVERQSFLPGYDEGRYEPKRIADLKPDNGLLNSRPDEPAKRDSRVSLRVSSQDLQMIQREAMRQGVPSQSLLASIIRDYVSDLDPEMEKYSSTSDVPEPFKMNAENKASEEVMRPDFSRGVSLNEVFVEAVRKENYRQLKKSKGIS